MNSFDLLTLKVSFGKLSSCSSTFWTIQAIHSLGGSVRHGSGIAIRVVGLLPLTRIRGIETKGLGIGITARVWLVINCGIYIGFFIYENLLPGIII